MQRKNPAWFQIHAGFYCELEGLSPDGDLFYSTGGELHQTREPWHPSCHGSKIPAKPHVPLRPSRPMDAMWGQGALPLVRAMRPVAEWRPFLFNKQGNHTRPASREARRRAAVKPRPTGMSHEQPRALWARCGVQGYYPCYTVRVSCSPRRAAFSARRGRIKVERNSSTCWALRPV